MHQGGKRRVLGALAGANGHGRQVVVAQVELGEVLHGGQRWNLSNL